MKRDGWAYDHFARMCRYVAEKPFRVRIGINTGHCTDGNFGSQDRMDYTIIGNAVNLTARLQSLSEIDGILMGHETHSLLLGLSQLALSELAGVGINTVKRIELTEEIIGSARTLWKIQTALENAGVEFIPADGKKGSGLRLKHKVRAKRVKQAVRRGKSP